MVEHRAHPGHRPDAGIGQEPSHQHRDVTGGWLRPTVFGMMDGLVSNFALIAGVAGASATSTQVSLAGLAGLVGGAFSMAAGEYISVQSQNELTGAELDVERRELAHNADAELAELTEVYVAARSRRTPGRTGRPPAFPRPGPGTGGARTRGTRRSTRSSCPTRGSRRVRRCSPSASAPWCRCCPTPFGAASVWTSALLATIALFLAGVVTSRFTSRGWLLSGSRQLVLGVVAATITYGVGLLFHAGIS